jgi:hypothetical protein
MKKIILTLLLSTVSIVNAQKWNRQKISESGHIITTQRITSSYDEIGVSGSFEVNLITGKVGEIAITADENIIPYIITEVKNNQLSIYFEKNKNINHKSKITIEVPIDNIKSIQLIGSGNITSKNTIVTNNLNVHLMGSGDISLDVQTASITTSVSGSGDVNIKGTSADINATVIGSGKIDADQLKSDNATVDVNGSGDIKLFCSKKLLAMVAGSGTIHYKGKPETVEKTVAGSGDITGN